MITKPETSKRIALTSLLDLKYPCFRWYLWNPPQLHNSIFLLWTVYFPKAQQLALWTYKKNPSKTRMKRKKKVKKKVHMS